MPIRGPRKTYEAAVLAAFYSHDADLVAQLEDTVKRQVRTGIGALFTDGSPIGRHT